MKFTPLPQSDDSSCGPTSIAMVAAYFGVGRPAEEIEKISGYKKRGGMWNADVLRTLRALGLRASDAANVTWPRLMKAANDPKKAVIVCWMLRGTVGHYSVVERVTRDNIVLADPAEGGLVEMDKETFLKLWMDYERMPYPRKNTDIQLRWMAVASKAAR